jgi:hypothetical protein
VAALPQYEAEAEAERFAAEAAAEHAEIETKYGALDAVDFYEHVLVAIAKAGHTVQPDHDWVYGIVYSRIRLDDEGRLQNLDELVARVTETMPSYLKHRRE